MGFVPRRYRIPGKRKFNAAVRPDKQDVAITDLAD
jgi:hypothetical protein